MLLFVNFLCLIVCRLRLNCVLKCTFIVADMVFLRNLDALTVQEWFLRKCEDPPYTEEK